LQLGLRTDAVERTRADTAILTLNIYPDRRAVRCARNNCHRDVRGMRDRADHTVRPNGLAVDPNADLIGTNAKGRQRRNAGCSAARKLRLTL